MAPLVQALADNPAIESKVCVTAQHREMLDQVLALFGIKPDFDLNIMKPGQDMTAVTAGILSGMQGVLQQFQPDYVLVHGDTATTLAASLAAYYQRIPVGHVEAGLRTGDIYPLAGRSQPQVDRRLGADPLRPYRHFQGQSPGRGRTRKRHCGNRQYGHRCLVDHHREYQNDLALRQKLEASFPYLRTDRRVILITGHRRESFGAGFERICESVAAAAANFQTKISSIPCT